LLRAGVWGAAGISVISGVALGERLLDPFDRHDQNYTLEGPQRPSDVFYLSVNSYEGGEKHDDRLGDLMLFLEAASVFGYVALRLVDSNQRTAQSPA